MFYRIIGIIIIHIVFLFPVNLYSSSLREDYELSEQCGKRCEEHFIKILKPLNFNIYHSHYNKRLNKCFILFYNGSVKYLKDVNENRLYGWVTLDKDGNTLLCSVRDKECKSEKEWDLLIKPYMEE